MVIFPKAEAGKTKERAWSLLPPKSKWINPADQHATKVEVTVTLSNDKEYTLRVSLPSDFPNSCPSMIVSVPRYCLKKKNGSSLNVSSGEDHTLPSKDGCTQICYCRPDLWRNDYTLYQVITKGVTWLEAYEVHLETGDPLDWYLQTDESFLLDGVVKELQ